MKLYEFNLSDNLNLHESKSWSMPRLLLKKRLGFRDGNLVTRLISVKSLSASLQENCLIPSSSKASLSKGRVRARLPIATRLPQRARALRRGPPKRNSNPIRDRPAACNHQLSHLGNTAFDQELPDGSRSGWESRG